MMAPSVYILLHSIGGITNVAAVYSALEDANAQCLIYAQQVKIKPEPQIVGGQPLRWEAPDGEASWVEKHTVTPRQATTTALRPNGGMQRKKSALYDSEEDDAIEVQDTDGHYD